MLDMCTFDDIPGWARAEMEQCSPGSWHALNKAAKRPKTVSIATSSTEVVLPTTPDGIWVYELVVAIWTEDSTTWTTEYRSGSGAFSTSHVTTHELVEPLFLLTARWKFKREKPSDFLNNQTDYPLLRIASGAPLAIELAQVNDSYHGEVWYEYSRPRTIVPLRNTGWAVYEAIANANAQYSMLGGGYITPESLVSEEDFYQILDEIERLMKYSVTTSYRHWFYDQLVDSHDGVDEVEPWDWFFQLEESLGWPHYLTRYELEQDEFSQASQQERESMFFDQLTESSQRLQRQLIQKMSRGPVDLGIVALESRQTAKMLIERFLQLRDALSALKRRDRKALSGIFSSSPKSRKRRKRGSSISPETLYLEYNFGWKQLYNDINGLLEVLLTEMYTEGQEIVVRAYAVNEEPLRSLVNRLPGANGWRNVSRDLRVAKHDSASLEPPVVLKDNDFWEFRDSLTNPQKTVVGQTAHTRWRVRDVRKKTLQSLGIANPVVALWDFVPYSFIIDWVFSLDTLIKYVSYDDGLEQLPGSTSMFSWTGVGVNLFAWSDEGVRVVNYPNANLTSLLTFRMAIPEFPVEPDLGSLIKDAAAPTKLYQLSTLLSMAVQRLK